MKNLFIVLVGIIIGAMIVSLVILANEINAISATQLARIPVTNRIDRNVQDILKLIKK